VSPTLGIETSCDETAAAVVTGGRMLSNVISSSVEFHRRFGGVVPEIAARKQIELISPVVQAALEQAGLGLGAIQGVAVTTGPGLIGSLLVGVAAAKAIAAARQIPFVGVNHLEGHVFSNFLDTSSEGEFSEPALPAIALIVSGGHSHLVLVEDFGRYKILGRTRDDAPGEAFDKAARLLELGYPGGPALDAASEGGNPEAIAFPRAKLGRSWDFSFSGIKTALARYLATTAASGRPPVRDIAASFQRAVVEPLVDNTIRAALEFECRTVLVCGGVAANRALRASFAQAAQDCDLDLRIPPLVLCTDNAAMIARAGELRLRSGLADSLDTDACASLELSSWP